MKTSDIAHTEAAITNIQRQIARLVTDSEAIDSRFQPAITAAITSAMSHLVDGKKQLARTRRSYAAVINGTGETP